uniref:Uncharacterized protein n=1 Tax=Plectus sambesii TaxID=2011161 RepID=A0A914VAS5_9BILA
MFSKQSLILIILITFTIFSPGNTRPRIEWFAGAGDSQGGAIARDDKSSGLIAGDNNKGGVLVTDDEKGVVDIHCG